MNALQERRLERRRAETFYEQRGERVPLVTEALCFSISCDPEIGSGRVLASVSRSATFCPSCGHALHWRQRKVTAIRRRRSVECLKK